MSAGPCPKKLPIEIEIIITDGKAEGFIFNNGGGNTHKWCKLYHNGTISGKVDSKGNVDFKVNQESGQTIDIKKGMSKKDKKQWRATIPYNDRRFRELAKLDQGQFIVGSGTMLRDKCL